MRPLDRDLFEKRWLEYGFVLGGNIRKYRHQRGLSQRDLAYLSGVSRTGISNLERNESNNARAADPVVSTIYRLAVALDVSPACLLPQANALVDYHTPILIIRRHLERTRIS